MFSAFLSKDMTYSCGIFKDLDGDLLRGAEEVGETNGGLGLMKFGKGAKSSRKANGKANGNHGKAHEEQAEDDADIDELEEAQLRKIRYVERIRNSMLCSWLGTSSRRPTSSLDTECWKLGPDGAALPSK
jgi:cyclopropane-fatty-acyl-phospholipid synthase